MSSFLILVIHKLRIVYYTYYSKLSFKVHGVCFGANLNVYGKVYIRGIGKISIGDDLIYTSGHCYNAICRNIRGSFYTMTKDARIEIGNRVGISSACIWAKDSIVIGNDVNIGGDCIIMDNDAHPHNYLERRRDFIAGRPFASYYNHIPSAPITIGDDVWIGARCMILKGVHIGARSIIAAGSVVTRDIPADVVAGGNPCRVIRSLSK